MPAEIQIREKTTKFSLLCKKERCATMNKAHRFFSYGRETQAVLLSGAGASLMMVTEIAPRMSEMPAIIIIMYCGAS